MQCKILLGTTNFEMFFLAPVTNDDGCMGEVR